MVRPKDASALFQSGSLLYEQCIKILKTTDKHYFDVQFQKWKKHQDVVYGDYSKHANRQSQINTFLNHTYMATVAKVLAHVLVTKNNAADKKDIITGAAFKKLLIMNFITEDFFSWIVQAGITDDIVERIEKEALRVQFDKISFDMLRSIYETIEEPENKHLVGASYTPDWLAEMAIDELMDMTDTDAPRILDPACGSGTFLLAAIRMLTERLRKLDVEEHVILGTILNCVVGLDVQPVAILFSKTNYLIAIMGMIRASNRNNITIPIYIADSINCPPSKQRMLGPFDVVAGNPPWITYKSFKDSRRSGSLKDAVTCEFKLQTKETLFPSMEIATLFFVKSARDFLKIGGYVGFVMPWSILHGKQHDMFRACQYKGVNLKYVKMFDHGEGVNQVSNMFTVESCTLFAKKVAKHVLTRSFPVKRLKGRSPGKDTSLKKIIILKNKDRFGITDDIVRLHETFDGNVWNYTNNPGYSKSPYADAFMLGATIVPHSFWYIEEDGACSGKSQRRAFVRTSHYVRSKKPWNVQIDGVVERDFLFRTIKSEDMVQFAYVKTRGVVLPVLVESDKFIVLDETGLTKHGLSCMQRYHERAQKFWLALKTDKSPHSVSKYINNLNKISNQKPSAMYAVIYNKSGRNYMVSCVVNVDKFDRRLIFNTSTYYAYLEEDEAKYLCTVLNSKYVFSLVKNIKNARDISRNVFNLNIPKYDPSDTQHSRLATLHDDCQGIIERNINKIVAYGTGRRRNLCFKLLKKEMKEIDSIMSQMIDRG